MSWFDRNLWREFQESAVRERALLAQRDRRRDREREDLKDDRTEANTSDLVSAIEQVAELREIEERLDALELEVTQALIENDRRLDAVNERIDALLSQAFVLPDGRRVFKTEDGTQVFDENGEEVDPEIVAPSDIPDDAPSWEDFEKEIAEREALERERERLHGLQEDIDAVRDAAENGELDMSELDALEAEFGDIEAKASEASPSSETAGSTGSSGPTVATQDTASKFQL